MVLTRAQSGRSTKLSVSVKKLRKKIKKSAKTSRDRETRNCFTGQVQSQFVQSANMNNQHVHNPFISSVPFCRTDPVSWFRQLEAIFAIQNIDTDETKYMLLQARLDPTILSEVSDFFNTPPENDKYVALKNRIVRQYADSRDKQILKVLEETCLGDRRPSELLCEMRKLAGNDLTEDVLMSLFLKRLPREVRNVVAGSSEPLDRLCDLADRVFDYAGPAKSVAAVAEHSIAAVRTPTAPGIANQQLHALNTLIESVAKLTTRIANLEAGVMHNATCSNHNATHRHSRSRDRSPTPIRGRSRSSQPPTGIPICYYHYNFGEKARNCKNLEDGSACKWSNLNG
jgi:hypothetical protein